MLNTLRRPALAAALLLAACTVGAQNAAPPAASKPAAADAVRPEVGKLLVAAQQAIQAGNFAEALARLKDAEAVPNRTPYEVFVTDRTRGAAAIGAGDVTLALQAFDAVLASTLLPAGERAGLLEGMVVLAYNAKAYARVGPLAERYAKEGGSNPEVRTLQVQALYLSEDYAGAARGLRLQIEADEAAGRVPDEKSLRLWASSAAKLGDKPQYAQAAERMLSHYPTPALWADALARVPAQPGYSERLQLDLLRLRLTTGTLGPADAYLLMAQLAQTAGLPGEARRVLEAGFAAGVLGTGEAAAAHKRQLDTLSRQAADDEKSLAAAKPSVTDNNLNFSTGFALATIGQFDKGLPLMEQALAKGGLRNPDTARLHLGLAQFHAGQGDKAVQTWKTVQGGDGSGELARLWMLHARQQGKAAK